jgi:hypothetical protein
MGSCTLHGQFDGYSCPGCQLEKATDRIEKSNQAIANQIERQRLEARWEREEQENREREEAFRQAGEMYRTFVGALFDEHGDDFIARNYIKFSVPISNRFGRDYIGEFYREFLVRKMTPEAVEIFNLQEDLRREVDSANSEIKTLATKYEEEQAKFEETKSKFLVWGGSAIATIAGATFGWKLTDGWFLFRPFGLLFGALAGLLAIGVVTLISAKLNPYKYPTRGSEELTKLKKSLKWFSGEVTEGDKLVEILGENKKYLIDETINDWKSKPQNNIKSTIRDEIKIARQEKEELIEGIEKTKAETQKKNKKPNWPLIVFIIIANLYIYRDDVFKFFKSRSNLSPNNIPELSTEVKANSVAVTSPITSNNQVESNAKISNELETINRREASKSDSPSAPSTIPTSTTEKTGIDPVAVESTQLLAGCNSVVSCANVMLYAAKSEALQLAMDAARKIDEMPKPERGDRKLARKLNAEALEALKQKKFSDAIATLSKAREADRLDEEIIANLVFAYSEDQNHAKAEQLAYEGLQLNPRRSNIWLPIAISKQKQGKSSEAQQAMWLTWQFSGDKEKLLKLIDKRIVEDTDETIKKMFSDAKVWLVDGKKPAL